MDTQSCTMSSDGRDTKPRRRDDDRPDRERRARDDSSERRERRDRDPDRERERKRDRHRERRRSRTPERSRDRRRKSASPVRKGPLPSQADSFALTARPRDGVQAHEGGEAEPEKEKEKPNYYPTGILAAASNKVELADGTSIALKYHEPPEARLPPSRDDWKLFVFKGKDVFDTVALNARSCWLVGREVRVVDLPAEHPSVSGQHAAIQFRHVEKRDEFGERRGGVKPYIIDLESRAGTTVNGGAVEGGRYVEVRSGDVVRFGESEREYVFMLDRK